jgi:hypothetical protein
MRLLGPGDPANLFPMRPLQHLIAIANFGGELRHARLHLRRSAR